MLFEIWREGYVVNEAHSSARLLGHAEGETFHEAVLKLAQDYGYFANYFNPEEMTYWGCRLFPTEEEARASFG